MHRAAGPACLALALVWFALWQPPIVRGAEPLDEQVAQEIRDYITSELARLAVPGAAVVVVHDDQIVFDEGFGIAQPDGTPATPQTPFRLASVSKSITALAVMQQVEAGNLDLDAPARLPSVVRGRRVGHDADHRPGPARPDERLVHC